MLGLVVLGRGWFGTMWTNLRAHKSDEDGSIVYVHLDGFVQHLYLDNSVYELLYLSPL